MSPRRTELVAGGRHAPLLSRARQKQLAYFRGRIDAGPVQPGHPDLTVLNVFRSGGLPLMGSDDSAERVLGHNTGSNPQRDLHPSCHSF
jgi:hypothetical protein